MKFLKTYIEDFWFLLYPHTCEACGVALNKNEGIICFKCLYDLPRTDYCEFIENPITELFAGRLKIERGTALFTFHKGSRFRKLLHSLKYKNKPEIGIVLGRELGGQMLKSNNFLDIDFLIPVPLHEKRKKQRGYNQSEMIAQGISQITKIPLVVDNLVRAKETVTQTKMTKEERWANVSGKFLLNNASELVGKHVMLVDDVVTTGSTIEACGEILLSVENLKLSIAVLAKA
ncbi:MAG TPA: phosphoribosyltransferase family protein [Bacteroidales bacterium]|nr:phosphoribosyltransferase family protein [Bacteroidales bacterium]HQB22251.1 phosphoribosyltransferase family protein [Bacteroidales bacterium]